MDLLASRAKIPGRPIVEPTLKKWKEKDKNNGKTFHKQKENFQSKMEEAKEKRPSRMKTAIARSDDIEPSYHNNKDDRDVARWLNHELTTNELDGKFLAPSKFKDLFQRFHPNSGRQSLTVC